MFVTNILDGVRNLEKKERRERENNMVMGEGKSEY